MSDDINRQEARNKQRKRKLERSSETKGRDFLSENYYRTLIVDTESDFEIEFAKSRYVLIIHNNNPVTSLENILKKKSMVNYKKENDKITYKIPKHIPGNSMQV